MGKAKSIDPFVCDAPEVEKDSATSRTLKQRMKTADQGRLIPAEEARQRIIGMAFKVLYHEGALV